MKIKSGIINSESDAIGGIVVTYMRQPIRRFTFEAPKIKEWVESIASNGKALNLFAGKVDLDIDEIRNDINPESNANHHKDALDFVREWDGEIFDYIILDPPYSYRKAMEKYEGKHSSRFNLIKDEIPKILKHNGKVISFGYHTTFMGEKRGFELKDICIMCHGGAQHDTIAIVEQIKKGE